MQQQIGIKVHRLVPQRGDRARSGRELRDVAQRAADVAKHLLPGERFCSEGQRRRRCEEPLEVRDDVNVRAVRDGGRLVLGIDRPVELREQRGLSIRRIFMREETVRDAHLVQVRVRGEAEDARVLVLHPETPDTLLAGRDIRDDRRLARDAVHSGPQRERLDRVIRDRLEQAEAEERRRLPARDRVRLARDEFADGGIDRSGLEQRAAERFERIENAVHRASETRHKNLAYSAGRGSRMAGHTGHVVEDRP